MINARPVIAGTLARYFALRFLYSTLLAFASIYVLVALVDYIELMRHSSGEQDVSAWVVAKTSLFRVPQLAERILPFTVLIAAMSSFLSLSRRLELMVARSAGVSAWQFVAPALIVAAALGVLSTTIYNPVAAALQEESKRLELQISGAPQSGLQATASGFWIRQRSSDGQAIVHANTSSDQGIRLGSVTIFAFDPSGRFQDRIEAKAATLKSGAWELEDARVYGENVPPIDRATYAVKTNLSPAQVRETFATPESVSFWSLPSYIDTAEYAGLKASAYRLQYQKLLSRPFLLTAMVLLAAAVSLRFFRFGGVQPMILSGIGAGFLLYVLSKVTDDLSRAEMMSAAAAAWLPVAIGGLTGFVALLFLEDG
jgi:lipopolysaccharide export system permease protein